MKIVGVMNVKDMSNWAGYAVGSVINYVDKLYVGLGPSQDGVGELLGSIRGVVGDKLVVFPEVTKEKAPGGSSDLKNRIFDKALSDSPDWILHMDADHIFYPFSQYHLSAMNDLKYSASMIRSHQIFLYAQKPNGTINTDLWTIDNPPDLRVDQSSFITFINPRFYEGWTGVAHENLCRVGGEDIENRDFSFIHTGPLDTEEHWIHNRVHYYRIEHPEITDDMVAMSRLVGLGEIHEGGGSALKHRMRTHKIKPFINPLPPITKGYKTGSSAEDIENIVNYIRSGR